MSDIDWMESAACQYVDPEIFFVEPGISAAPARRVCARCEVRQSCLEWALSTNQQTGVFGGRTENERKALRRQEERTAA